MSFPLTFPFFLPSGGAAGAYVPDLLSVGELAWEDSHCDASKERLLEQFHNKPRLEALICLLGDSAQGVEDALWQLLIDRNVERAVGLQLTNLGLLVGQPRDAFDDTALRLYIRARLLVNRSKGRPEDLIAILLAVLGSDFLWVFEEDFPAAVVITLLEAAALPGPLFKLLDKARAVCVRLSLVFPTAAPAVSFTFSSTSSPAADTARGFGDSVAGAVGGVLASVLSTP